MRKKIDGQIVEFSELNANNKAQFMQFLLQNNIFFQEGDQNFQAKVTLQTTPKNKNHKKTPLKHQNLNNESQRKKSSLKPIMNYKSIKKNTPTRRKNRINSVVQKVISPSPIKKTKQKSELRDSQYKKSFDEQTNRSHKKLSKNQNKVVKVVKKDKPKFNITTENVYKEIKPRGQFINKYTNLFNHCLTAQRPIRWSIHQMYMQIQDIYDDSFIRNTNLLQNKNFLNSMRHCEHPTFTNFIEIFLQKKYKCEKLVVCNLTNMLYSLSYYIHRNQCPPFLKIFEDFMTQIYEFEDLVFYLFARNMIKKELIKKNKHDLEGEWTKVIIDSKSILCFLKSIMGQDSQLLSQYRSMIFQKIHTDILDIDRLLRILLEDYKAKRIEAEQIQKYKSEDNGDMNNTVLKLTDLHHGKGHLHLQKTDTQNITFTSQVGELDSFWIGDENNDQQIADSLYKKIGIKMKEKVIDLVNILIEDQSDTLSNHKELQDILLKKSMKVFQTIYFMNKFQFFRQLCIKNPSEKDMDKVQQLQISMRGLKLHENSKDISEMCKNILTLSQFMQQLYKLL